MTEVKEQRIIIENNSKLVDFTILIMLIVLNTYCVSHAKFKKSGIKANDEERNINKFGCGCYVRLFRYLFDKYFF